MAVLRGDMKLAKPGGEDALDVVLRQSKPIWVRAREVADVEHDRGK
jgi:hypothetical protein